MLFLPSEARTRHLCSTSCPFFPIFCNCALLLRVAAPQKNNNNAASGQTSTPQPFQSANQHATERSLTSLHGDPHGSLLRAPLVHARQLAQEPIWLQDHLNKATQIREWTQQRIWVYASTPDKFFAKQSKLVGTIHVCACD
jgi:hypothetical protein